jgi:hypothetical protein
MALQLLNQWAQLLFGISDYTAGIESTIDPSAPAKKAEIVVAQGNVRLNMLLKRKISTLKNIFFRWYLLYRDNMPPNKFMRITGDDTENPWKFESLRIEDFQLKALPDFQIIGNVLAANKTLAINSALSLYQIMISNPFFSPQTQQGLTALHSLTKWLLDKLDDMGVSRFLPKPPGDNIMTPEEENARFLQGQSGVPVEGEDHVAHIRSHSEFLSNPTTPEQIKPEIAKHIAATVELLKQQVTMQTVMQQSQMQNMPGGMNGQAQAGGPGGVFPGQARGMGGPEVGAVRVPGSGGSAGFSAGM